MIALEQKEYLDYREGLNRVDSFIAGQADFADLAPFRLPAINRTMERDRSVFGYYLGERTGSQRYLNFSLEDGSNKYGDYIYVEPNALTSSKNPYFWLDFSISPADETPERLLTSCRLKPEDSINKIDFQHWHGIGEQLLGDYVLEKADIQFSELVPFTLFVRSRAQLNGYRIASYPQLKISLGENSSIGDNTRLHFVPLEDDNKFYQWVDILQPAEDTPIEKWPLVSSYRVMKEIHSIYSTGWGGLEKQMLFDYASGDPKISFDHLKPIQSKARAGGTLVTIVTSRRKNLSFSFNLPPGLLEDGQETISVPRRDPRGPYEWLELHRYNEDTKEVQEEPIAYAQITEKGTSSREWLGLQRQLLRDFSKRIVVFTDVDPLDLEVGKGKDLINLWKEGGKKIYLVLSRYFNLQTGDQLKFTPEAETPQGGTFLLIKDQQVLARYEYNRENNRFNLRDNIAFNGDLAFTYDTDNGVYIDPENNRWLSQAQAIKVLRVSFQSLALILNDIPGVRYLDSTKSDKPTTLYSESQILDSAKNLGLSDINSWQERKFDFIPNVDILTFGDDEGHWVARSTLRDAIPGLNDSLIDELTDQARIKDIRGLSGKTVSVYNLEQFVSIDFVKERLSLPITDNKTGIFVDDSGHWAVSTELIRRYKRRVAWATLQRRFLPQIRSKSGISYGHLAPLYNIDELDQLEELQSFIAKPQTDPKTGVYRDMDGHVWTDLDCLKRTTGIGRAILEKIIEAHGVASLEGRSRSGREINLYDQQMINDAIQAFKEKGRSISSEEAEEDLNSLFR